MLRGLQSPWGALHENVWGCEDSPETYHPYSPQEPNSIHTERPTQRLTHTSKQMVNTSSTYLQSRHARERQSKWRSVTAKVTIPPKLSFFCVSIYAVKAEKKKKKIKNKKHLWKDQAGRGKHGGRRGEGGCCRWEPKHAIKIKEAKRIMRLQGYGTERPGRSTVSPDPSLHCRDGYIKTSGIKGELSPYPLSLPPHSNIVLTIWQEIGWAKEAFDPESTVSLFRDVYAAVSSFQKERMRRGESEWLYWRHTNILFALCQVNTANICP